MNKLSYLLSTGLVAGLAAPFVFSNAAVQADTPSQIVAQAETSESIDQCVALQEVSTGETEIRKRIENRIITSGNWNTDFTVPSNQEFSYFVAVITPENNGPYEFTANLRHSTGAVETPFSVRADLNRGETYSIPFQSPTGRQPILINARVGGRNGNFYTLGIVGCQ